MAEESKLQRGPGDGPDYQRSPLTVSKDGKSFSVCASQVRSILDFYALNKVKVYP
jgi:hypothetical protein